MAIYDTDGTTNNEIGKLYDDNGTTNHQIGKVYDYDGTTNNLIYSAEVTLLDIAEGVDNTGGFTGKIVDGGGSIGFITKASTGYRLNISGLGSSWGTARFFTKNTINFSLYSTITVTYKIEGLSSGNTVASLILNDNKTHTNGVDYFSLENSGSNVTKTITFTQAVAENQLGIQINADKYARTIEISKIILE